MQRIAIYTTDDGGEVAIQVVDDAPPGAVETAGEGMHGEVSGSDSGAPPGLTLRGIPSGSLPTRGVVSGRLVERTQQSLDEVLAHARPAVTTLLRQVRGQDDAPDELEVEFGIQISLEVGAYNRGGELHRELPSHDAVAFPCDVTSRGGTEGTDDPGVNLGVTTVGMSTRDDEDAHMDNIMELEIRPGPEPDSYVVEVLRSVGGGAPSSTFTLDLDELLGRRNQLEDSVLSSSVSARRVVSTQEAAIQGVGRLLFDSVFAGDVHSAYRTSLAVASDRGKGVRVVLRLTAPGLAALPWEAAFDSETGTYLSRKEPLVRQIPAAYSPPTLAVRPPLRILGMVSSPRGLPQLDVEGEKELLEAALRPHLDAGRVRIDWIDQVTWPRVHDKLLEREWHVLHFIGHGTYDTETEEGILAFEGRDGRADFVSASSLADLLDQAEPTPRLVFLNSCRSGTGGTDDLFSGIAAALVHSGIHAVAAMQFSISDTAAIEFARGFYAALAHGRGIDEAVRSGRIGILGVARGTLEWVTPVLYLRGEDTRLFDVVPIEDTPVDLAGADVPGRAPPESDSDSPSGGLPPTPIGPAIPTVVMAPIPTVPDPPDVGVSLAEAPDEPQAPEEPPVATAPDEPPTATQPAEPPTATLPDEPPTATQPAEPPTEPPSPDDGLAGPVADDGGPQGPDPQHLRKRVWIIGGIAVAALAAAGVIVAIVLSQGPTGVVPPDGSATPVATDTAAPNPEPTTITLQVPMASPWTPTGVQCATGDTLEISASGTAKHADNDDPRSTVGPEGLDQPGEEWFWQFNVDGLPDTPTASLIGSLDEAQPFFPVGRGTYTCPSTAEMKLTVNDVVNLGGNAGQFRARIFLISGG